MEVEPAVRIIKKKKKEKEKEKEKEKDKEKGQEKDAKPFKERKPNRVTLASVLDQLAVAFPAAHELALQAGRELAEIVSSVYAQQLELYKQCGLETPLPGAVR